ncbi:MAG: hypothetical protein GY725_13770 [bacterium]|nr:hypothetical protein [bacterium]
MMESVDRVQIAVSDRAATAHCWKTLLGAEIVREDKVQVLAARRTVLAAGTSEVELLEPDGHGAIANFLSAVGGPGLYAAGFESDDFDALRASLKKAGAALAEEGGQIFLAEAALGIPGLNVVVSPVQSRAPVGLLKCLYEVTLLVADARGSTAAIADCFGLDSRHFVAIDSEAYGYRGSLTLFDPDRLDRVEVIHPHDRTKTMGRFFQKRGPCLYMCYAETERSTEIRDRALEHASSDWTGPEAGRPDGLYLHPKALGGVMLGVSRTSFAWSWSGSPERIEP